MKEVNEVAKITYKNTEFNGYVKITKEEGFLEILTDDSASKDVLMDSIIQKTFHIQLSNYTVISCFDCNLINNRNDRVFTFKIGVFVTGHVRSYADLKFNKISAIFPKLDAWFVGREDNLKFDNDIIYKGKKLKISTSEGTDESANLHSQTITTHLRVTIQCDELIEIDLVKSFLFKFSTIFSFLCDSYVTYNHLKYVSDSKGFGIPIRIYQLNHYESNEFKIRRANYRPDRTLSNQEFKHIFLDPISSEMFDVWINYVAVIRFCTLLEEQYLGYARCLEILSRSSEENLIYPDKEVRRDKAKEYKKLVDGMDLDKRYKDNLKEAFKYSNRKGFKGLLVDYLQHFSFVDQLDHMYDGMELKSLVKKIVDLRDHLTHGWDINEVDGDSLFFYVQLTKRMVACILLQKQVANPPDLDIDYIIEQYDFLPQPIIKSE